MSLADWNERYRTGESRLNAPSPLVERFAQHLAPGRALDLACGLGRHALYLAGLGWNVTAVDGSPIAIELLREKARAKGLAIDARTADLELSQFEIPPDSFDLICDCLYLQRDLFAPIKTGLRAGGLVIVTVLLADSQQPHRVVPGELQTYFSGWTILHSHEEPLSENGATHSIAELVALRPE